MSCRDILAQLRQIQDPSRFLSEAQSLSNQARALRNTTVTASNKDKIINDANQILAQLEQLKQQRLAGLAQLRSLLEAASREKCDDAIRFGEDLRIRYTQAGNEANTAGNITNQAKSTANAFVQETKAAESAAKQNNAGNGQPGSAGTSSTANDLQEVTVTGKKTPATVNEPGTTPTDSLDEVQVTGKRTPAAVTEPTSGDGLEEVTVTGKRATDPGATGNNNTVPGIKKAQSQAALKDTSNFEAKKDWRVRLSLSPGANYLYKAQNPGILAPLLVTDGVLFPYTPSIQVNYTASYDGTQLTHSNYKFFQYTSSNVDSVNLTCDFTAQDTYEANYLLAVIHFFRSATKMFYGQDENPKPGTPPPLCYLFGLGEYQFNAHPLAITNFSYSLPNNVDYIRANLNESGLSNFSPTARRTNAPTKAKEKPKILDAVLGAVQQTRLVQGVAKLGKVIGVDLIPGGGLANPSSQLNKGFNSVVPPGTNEPTYVPTSIQLSISCVPIVSRYDISNTFSLRDYATGELLRGVKRSGGGIW